MDINGILGSLLKNQAIKVIAKKTGLDESSAKDMAAKALPIILGALKNNASDDSKKESLERVVEKNDGSVLSNLDNIDLEDGEKILGHVFGNKKADIEKKVGNASILAALAPMVMGALGKANSDTGSSVGDLLSSDGMIMKITTSFLDKDGDGDIKDDLMGMAMDFMKGKS